MASEKSEEPKDSGKPRAFKRARRVDSAAAGDDKRQSVAQSSLASKTSQPQHFALLDLDGTLFHMMPEAELPGNIENVTEAVVPLPDGAMRKLISKKKLQQSGEGEDAEVAIEAAQTAHAGREEALAEKPRGWSGSPVIRVTVVVDRAPGSKRLPEDVVEALRTDPKGTRVVILDDNPTAWEARAREHIWIVPQFDVRRPLTRVELDDELGLLERISERCKRYFSPKQQTQTQSAKSFSRQPRSSLEKSNASSESGMAGDVKRPKPQPATTSQASLEQPLTTDCNEDCSTPHNENGESFAERPTASESNERKSSRPKRRKPDEPAQSKRITRSTIQYFKKMAAHQVSTRSSRSSRKVLVDCDYDEEDDHESFQSENGEEDEDGEDPEWEQTLMACRAARERSKRRRRYTKESDDEGEEEVIESAKLPS